jgi:hypothetical protein
MVDAPRRSVDWRRRKHTRSQPTPVVRTAASTDCREANSLVVVCDCSPAHCGSPIDLLVVVSSDSSVASPLWAATEQSFLFLVVVPIGGQPWWPTVHSCSLLQKIGATSSRRDSLVVSSPLCCFRMLFWLKVIGGQHNGVLPHSCDSGMLAATQWCSRVFLYPLPCAVDLAASVVVTCLVCGSHSLLVRSTSSLLVAFLLSGPLSLSVVGFLVWWCLRAQRLSSLGTTCRVNRLM